jgi:hypothetical protein
MKLSKYILLSQKERIRHIDLLAPCNLVLRTRWRAKFKSEMIKFLSLEDDIPLWRGKIHRCHACRNDTEKSHVCINPLHLYIGTPLENLLDRAPEKAAAGGLSHRGRKRNEGFCRQNREKRHHSIDVCRPNTGEFMRVRSQKLAAFIFGVSPAAVSGWRKSGKLTKDGLLFKSPEVEVN